MANEELTLEALAAKFDVMNKNFAGLQEENKALQAQNEALAMQNKALHGENAELSLLTLAAVSGKGVTIETAPPKLPSEPFFTYRQKRYEILVPCCEIPGIGYRTADEILQDVKAQEALLKLDAAIIRPA